MESSKISFRFRSLNSECVTCVCLQCGKRKQNCDSFLGKTATTDKCTVSLRDISIVYLFGLSLVTNTNLSYGCECEHL